MIDVHRIRWEQEEPHQRAFCVEIETQTPCNGMTLQRPSEQVYEGKVANLGCSCAPGRSANGDVHPRGRLFNLHGVGAVRF